MRIFSLHFGPQRLTSNLLAKLLHCIVAAATRGGSPLKGVVRPHSCETKMRGDWEPWLKETNHQRLSAQRVGVCMHHEEHPCIPQQDLQHKNSGNLCPPLIRSGKPHSLPSYGVVETTVHPLHKCASHCLARTLDCCAQAVQHIAIGGNFIPCANISKFDTGGSPVIICVPDDVPCMT